MNELFNVTTNGDKLTLSARDLHNQLQIHTKFNDWFSRMKEYGFDEGTDFYSFLSESTGGRPATDYQITLDMAKEIAMLQRNEKGKQIRKKLIELEKAWNSPEKVMARALDIAHKTIANLQIENEEMKPKAFFADAVKASDSSILIGDLAKLIKQNGYDIGEKKLYRWLREKGYICKNSTDPTQMAMNLGLFEIVVRTIERGDASPKVTRTTKVTGKGQVYFINKLCNSNCSLYDLEPLF